MSPCRYAEGGGREMCVCVCLNCLNAFAGVCCDELTKVRNETPRSQEDDEQQQTNDISARSLLARSVEVLVEFQLGSCRFEIGIYYSRMPNNWSGAHTWGQQRIDGRITVLPHDVAGDEIYK